MYVAINCSRWCCTSSWALLFITCFYLAYTCASIPSNLYRASIDASILMYAIAPENFAAVCACPVGGGQTRPCNLRILLSLQAYPIIYHRYLRQGELEPYSYSPRGRGSIKHEQPVELRSDQSATASTSPSSIANTPPSVV